ncbi:hypothetical protein [Sinorhizobium terangae]|uniref:Uncharacterized protein n=1 Tax=Sinorhizobium terangae TaxID=110322 RepID=A0A6N7LQN1_SINTE|nr:hypothetical protein [Sinorhizobium terangae]MBB4183601.1 hypothetical protein [Sinorhizobium terangae]MQX18734.1 hypothetical protein [Sinorhizobium terangae]WFU47755.1 hypothetical protein QA637_18225 [Sinorhizobium terangae]
MATTLGVFSAAAGPFASSLLAPDSANPLSADAVASGSGSGSGKSGGGSSGSGGGSHSGSGHSGGQGSNGGSGGGNGGGGHGQDNDNGDDRRAGNDDDDDRRRDRPDRPEVALKVPEERLRGLLNGSLVAVDNLGRVLEVEVEFEHGARFVTVKPHGSDARRNPGPIGSVSIRSARTP